MTSIFDDIPAVAIADMPEAVRRAVTTPAERPASTARACDNSQNGCASKASQQHKPTFVPPRGRAEKALIDMRLLVGKGYRIDEALMRWTCEKALWLYHQVTSFSLAWSLLRVSDDTHNERLRYCTRCPFRKRKTLLHGYVSPVGSDIILDDDYCHAGGVEGKGCGCPETRAWPPSRLWNKTRLRNWRCPLGFWGRTRPGPVSDEELDEFFGVNSRPV